MGYQRYTQEYTSAFIDHSLYSKVLSEQRKIFIRLPKSYDENKTYPLIIKSDGNFNLSRWDESLTQLAQAAKVEDSIIVAIPNLFWTDSRNRDLVPPFARKDVAIEARPPNDNSPEIFGRADLFLSFIETEVLPYVEANYKVSENRVLTGFSAGGSFVLYTLITKPELFSGYFAFSPAAWYDDSVVVREFEKGLKNVEGDPLFLYLSIGGAENDIITGSFKGLLKAIDSYGPENFYTQHSYSEGAGHVENPYTSVPLALKSYYQFRNEKL
ncbi:alpha/beta hydrolase [Pseudoalteromonas luteoviolacea]|uniref:alpha/beta hydrolase n=1 Tax=Pseudoalteromonas luteoviolacea TaxID=43657 RepID=UPI003F7E9B33